MSESWLTPLLTNLLVQSPVLLVEFVGIILALAFWRRHPGVSLTFLLAMLLLIATNVVGTIVSAWLPVYAREQGEWSAEKMGWAFTVIAAMRSLATATGWLLTLFAVFGGRSGSEKQTVHATPFGK